MITVKVTSSVPQWPLWRQIKGSKNTWNDFKFLINDNANHVDYWIVLDDLAKNETVTCNPQNIILFAQEPPEIKIYNKKFLNQFNKVITSHRQMQHKNLIFTQQSLPWMVGVKFASDRYIPPITKSYGELLSMKPPKKTKLLSVIVSSKQQTKGHKQRLLLVEKLKQVFKEEIDLFGSGHNHIPDKWDAIAPYRYHLALENSQLDDYWTEKLTDAFLGFAFPLYWGCPNLVTYFSKKSFIPIDIYNPEKTIDIIKHAIEKDYYSKNIDEISNARDLILNKYQIFPSIMEMIKSDIANNPKPDITKSIRINNQAFYQKNYFQRLFL